MRIDMGSMVEKEFRAFKAKNRGCNVTWFAGQLNCDRRNIYDIFRRPTIDTQLLSQICIVLKHNFFRDIADMIENSSNYYKPDALSGLSFIYTWLKFKRLGMVLDNLPFGFTILSKIISR